jgi:transposase
MKKFCLLEIPSDEKETLKWLKRRHPTPRVRERANIILVSVRGFNQTEVAKILGISRPYVIKTLKNYKEKGFIGLYEYHPGANPKLTPKQEEQFIN